LLWTKLFTGEEAILLLLSMRLSLYRNYLIRKGITVIKLNLQSTLSGNGLQKGNFLNMYNANPSKILNQKQLLIEKNR